MVLAIAALRELARHLELKARLQGELRDREITITNVQVDPVTLSRMAEMFLARRKPAILVESTGEEGQRNE